MRDPVRKPKFTVVCAATHRTHYVEGLRELLEDLDYFGIPFVALTYEPGLSWYESTRNKPHQIRRARKCIDGPVFWMDADSRLLQYPTFLDTLSSEETDIAISRRWPSAPMYKLDRVAGGGCFWLADTPAADSLLETWIDECDASSGKGIDDVILTHVLDRMLDVRETKLPDEYLSVEDLSPLDKQTDVVRHLQYSRKSRRLNYDSYH